MEEKLKLFHEDIETIFEIAKEQYNYDGFAITCKKTFEEPLNEMLKVAKESIEPYIYETEKAVELLAIIQESTNNLLRFYKQTDENFKTGIYRMSPCFEIDSHLVYDFNDENWYEINKFE